MKRLLIAVALALAFAPADKDPREFTVRLFWLRAPQALEAVASGPDARVRFCDTCDWEPLPAALRVEASGSAVSVSGRAKAVRLVQLQGSYEIRTTGNDPVALRDPLTIKAADGWLALDLRLPLEEYVAAVVAGEAGGMREPEAVRAMAVAARTYAARFRGRHSAEGFDLCDTTHCQDLHLTAVTPRVRAAVESTEGEMLWFEGRPAATFYHRNCGGTTEDVALVWPGLEAPYLGRHADPYCVVRDRGEWHAMIAEPDLRGALDRAGLGPLDAIREIRVLERSPSGRVTRLEIQDSSARRVTAQALRRAVGQNLGWHLIRSDAYQVHRAGAGFRFEGFGSGHGVGLCQIGAQQMAAEEKGYQEILEFYYPGTHLGLTAGSPSWSAVTGDRVELLTTDPQGDRRLLELAGELVRQAEQTTGWTFPQRPQLRVYPTVEFFRNATGEPGWVAASTRGRVVRLQPLDRLERSGSLRDTVLHELFHMLIDARMTESLPLWFREGLVLYLTRPASPADGPRIPLGELERRLLTSRSQDELRTAYRSAHATVTRLVERYGRARVLAWVSEGLPPDLDPLR